MSIKNIFYKKKINSNIKIDNTDNILKTNTIKIDNRNTINTNIIDNLLPLYTQKLYTAVIIEPRKHKALEFVLQNYTYNLKEDEWYFVIYCSFFNKEFVEDIKKKLNINIDVIPICDNNITIPNYNYLLTNTKFYEVIPTDLVLIFQTDSLILNKEIIYDFLKYDYVGAPWFNEKTVGNGGLSLRNKNKMIEIINIKGECKQNEDFYFSFPRNYKIEIYKPTFEEGMRFSVEQCYHEKSFGIHKVWRNLKNEEYQQLIKIYPQIEKLKSLQ
jgi:hypothetical protein